MLSESERDAVHAAFDEVVANVLQDRCKEPTELGTTGVIGRSAEKRGERAKQGFDRLCLEGLIRPRSDALHAKSVGLHACRGRGEVRGCCRKWGRGRKHAR